MRGAAGRCGCVRIQHAIIVTASRHSPPPPRLLPLRRCRRLSAVPSPPAMAACHTSDGNETKEKGIAPKPEVVTPQPPPPPILEPPEKPLPGDCCGSGCVRCVWDVYYEELEDYQKSLPDNNKD